MHSARNIILTIVSLVAYWTGALSTEIQEQTAAWMPQDFEAIPLQVVSPEDQLMLDWVTKDNQ